MNEDKTLEALYRASIVINTLWNALDGEAKEEFKIALTVAVADSASPIWKES